MIEQHRVSIINGSNYKDLEDKVNAELIRICSMPMSCIESIKYSNLQYEKHYKDYDTVTNNLETSVLIHYSYPNSMEE